MVTIRLKDKENGCLSKEVSIEDIILNQYEIEFEFPNYIDEYGNLMDVATLPYKDFLFFQNDYEVIINEHTPIIMEVDEEHVKQQLDYFKNRDLVYVNGGRGYGKTQYEKLQHNWDELKKWLEEDVKENDNTIKKCDQVIFEMGNEHKKDTHQHKLIDVCSRESLVFNRILNKMQELEQGKDG